jgi:hypothetical protein
VVERTKERNREIGLVVEAKFTWIVCSCVCVCVSVSVLHLKMVERVFAAYVQWTLHFSAHACLN